MGLLDNFLRSRIYFNCLLQNEEWLDDCQTILNDILSQPGSDLLRYPIDENEYPVREND